MAKLSSTARCHLILTVILIVFNPSEAASASAPLDFIRSSCASTRYPNLCFATLSPYASDINCSPLKLSEIATSHCLNRIRSLSIHVSALLLTPTSSTTITRALKDCSEVLGSAADRTKASVAELKKLKGAASGTKSRWCLSNVKMWMSAVLTNEETCKDGLREVAPTVARRSSVVVDVWGKIGVAKKYTSIALALVNKLGYGIV